MRAAAVQLDSTADRGRNLDRTERLVRAAADDGATLVVLPERFDLRGTDDDYLREAEPLDGPTVERVRALARDLRIDLVAGSMTERRPGHEKPSNTSLHVGPDGEIHAVYRKIHLFDVTVGETDYRESDSDEPGDEIVTSEALDGTRVGLSVCYDVRFPELYRILALEGAQVVTVPAHFTTPTGKDHWHVLLRARAIENQLYVVAAAQVGETLPRKPAYGRSLIVDPWGVVLAQAPDEPTVISAELDRAHLDDIRAKLPSLANRQANAYRWPAPA